MRLLAVGGVGAAVYDCLAADSGVRIPGPQTGANVYVRRSPCSDIPASSSSQRRIEQQACISSLVSAAHTVKSGKVSTKNKQKKRTNKNTVTSSWKECHVQVVSQPSSESLPDQSRRIGQMLPAQRSGQFWRERWQCFHGSNGSNRGRPPIFQDAAHRPVAEIGRAHV